MLKLRQKFAQTCLHLQKAVDIILKDGDVVGHMPSQDSPMQCIRNGGGKGARVQRARPVRLARHLHLRVYSIPTT